MRVIALGLFLRIIVNEKNPKSIISLLLLFYVTNDIVEGGEWTDILNMTYYPVPKGLKLQQSFR